MSKNILTPEGAKKITREISELTAKRKVISEKIAKAKDHGDLSENAEYHDAREEQGFNEGRIQELKAILADAKVVNNTTSSDTVSLGSTVTVRHSNTHVHYRIVGSHEASPRENKISIDSPMVQAMLGKKVHETFEVHAPSGKKQYTILHIK